jgi:hypothetical protein
MAISTLAVTVDLDWACEPAIEDLLAHLLEERVPVTVFASHRSRFVEDHMAELEVGLHPYFAADSSHGATVAEVVRRVVSFPHNLPAFRCHRFAVSNESREALWAAGLRISSNTCTDLEVVPPFYDRFHLLEVPIYLEDGGYLYQRHPLEVGEGIAAALAGPGAKVVLLHPMHFALNTPRFEYMADIKRSVTREAWNGMTNARLGELRFQGRGIRDFVIDLLAHARRAGAVMTTIGELARAHAASGRGVASTPRGHV